MCVCVSVLPEFTYMHQLHVLLRNTWCMRSSSDNLELDGCDLAGGFWELNQGPLQDKYL